MPEVTKKMVALIPCPTIFPVEVNSIKASAMRSMTHLVNF